MKKDKKQFILMGAGLGIIFGYAIWNAAAGLVIGAAIGLIMYYTQRKSTSKD